MLKELKLVIDRYGARVIWFYDDTFNYNPKRAVRICDLLIERRLDVKWYCEVRVDLMTRELTEKMAQDIVKKGATFDRVRQFIDWPLDCGVTPNPFFMFSHPTETWSEAQETMAIIEEVKERCDISVAIAHVYPGTELEKRAREEGKIPDDFSWTNPHDRRLVLLPAAQGHVPLYVDKLSWWQISELMFRFAGAKKGFSMLCKIPTVLRNIKSFADFQYDTIMFVAFMTLKVKK